jgi:hypothetical protein
MCKADLVVGMKFMVDHVLPTVADQLELKRRQGAIECVYRKQYLNCSNSCRSGYQPRGGDSSVRYFSDCSRNGSNE